MSIQTRKGRLTLRTWLACGFGLGFAPLAPGTVATAALLVPVRYAGLLPLPSQMAVFVPITVALVVVVLGVYLGSHAETQLGHDASSIVIDEFAGFLIAVQMLPKEWPELILVFALFRLFDILKPFPAGVAQRLPGGYGVVADDIIAGVYANLAARLVLAIVG
jgi:phosphatidylglycerophosphatase A